MYSGRLLTADVSLSAKKKLIQQVVFRVSPGSSGGKPLSGWATSHEKFEHGLIPTLPCLLPVLDLQENMNAPLGVKLKSLYPGFRFAVLYKVCQRTTTYGCQPFLYDYLNR